MFDRTVFTYFGQGYFFSSSHAEFNHFIPTFLLMNILYIYNKKILET